MTDLTPYLSPPDQKLYGPLYLDDGAFKQLADELSQHGVTELLAKDKLGPLVAASAMGLLRSPYMHNTWFRDQSVHTMSAFTLRNEQGEVVSQGIVHLLRRKGGPGFVMVSPSEHSLPEGYFEKRVIEETKVEMGIN